MFQSHWDVKTYWESLTYLVVGEKSYKMVAPCWTAACWRENPTWPSWMIVLEPDGSPPAIRALLRWLIRASAAHGPAAEDTIEPEFYYCEIGPK